MVKSELENAALEFANQLSENKTSKDYVHYLTNQLDEFKEDLIKITTTLDAYKIKCREDIKETVTGGLFLYNKKELGIVGFFGKTPFSNETLVNHFEKFTEKYFKQQILENFEPHAYFKQLEELGSEYFDTGMEIRRDIFKDPEVEKLIEVEEGGLGKEARITCDDKTEFKKAYLDAEFRKSEQIIDFLEKSKVFYNDTINFLERTIEIYEKTL